MRQFSSFSVVLILWFAGLCAAAQFAKIGLMLPELKLLYPEAGSGLGFLVSSLSLIGALFGLYAGAMATRIGLHRILCLGLILGSAVSLSQAYGLPLYLLLASRVLEGAAHLAIVVSAPTLIAINSSTQLRTTAMTLWGTFFGVSYALTAWFGLPLVESHGIHSLFLAHGLITAVVALLVYFLVSNNLPEKKSDIFVIRFTVTEFIQTHLRAWSSPFVSAPAAGWLFYTITFVALLSILPNMMPSEERAFTAAALPLSSIASSMTLGVYLLRKFTAVQVLGLGFVLAILSSVLVLLFSNEPLPCMALFASLGLVQGSTFSAIPQLNQDTAAQALSNGALAQAGNLGNLVGTPLLLGLLTTLSFTAAMTAVVTCYVTGLIAHWGLAKQRALATQKS